MKSEKQYLSVLELRRFYGITHQSIYRAIEYGHPSMVKGQGFDLLESCRWFAARERDGKAKARAIEYLMPKGVIPESAQPARLVQAKKRDKLGLEAAVERLRVAEVLLHDCWEKAKATKAGDARKCFRNWQDALELLNRAEPMLVKYRDEMGKVVETSEITAWRKRMVKRAEVILMTFPAELAPRCEGLPWHQAQKILDAEIRRAMVKIAEI